MSYCGAQSLLKDINTTPAAAGYDSAPQGFTPAATGELLFTAWTPDEGRELWKTDGTASGTELVFDIRPGFSGSNPGRFVTFGGRAYFFAYDDLHGLELWNSDGTADGTTLVLDSVPGPEGANYASSSSVNGPGILVAPLGANRLVFLARRPTGQSVWVSDGTAAGTQSVTSMEPGFPVRYIRGFGDKVIFHRGSELGAGTAFVTDGTSAGTIAVGTAVGSLHAAGGLAYFNSLNSLGSQVLNRTDGTVNGTFPITFQNTWYSSDVRPRVVGALGTDLVFTDTGGLGQTLYRTDGTVAGTRYMGPMIYGGQSERPNPDSCGLPTERQREP